jgi:hypothetical protein
MYYVITKGHYSDDKHIVGVTCDKQKSQKIKECYSDSYDDANIEEWDESTISFESYYSIRYDTDDDTYEIEKVLPPDESWLDINSISEYWHNDGFSVNVQAENEDVALKIARDLWAEYKAKKEEII